MIRRRGRSFATSSSGTAGGSRRRSTAWPPLDALEKDGADIVLLDLGMPVMDGFEFVAELRSRDEHRGIPVVVMTARDITDEDRRRLNGGVERVLQKASSSREELLGTLRDILRGRSWRES